MIIYAADRKMRVLGKASSDLPEGFHIVDDQRKEEIENGVKTFSCSICYTDDDHEDARTVFAVGNYIIRSGYDGQDEFYTIIYCEDDHESRQLSLTCEDAGLDLINEVCDAVEETKAHSLEYYASAPLHDTGFELRNLAENAEQKTLHFEEETAAARLLHIASAFDLEIYYSFTVTNMVITHKYVNFAPRRGSEMSAATFRMGREISNIIEKASIEELATAYRVTGGRPDGSETAVTLKGLKYSDGDFFVDEKNGYLYAKTANEKWSRYVWNREPGLLHEGGYIVRNFTSETTDRQELLKEALESLKACCQPVYNYDVSLLYIPENVRIGDTVNLSDDSGKVYLSARVLALSVSECSQKFEVTLGDYLIRDSGISDYVQSLAVDFKNLAASRPFYTWIVYADDENGTGISTDPGTHAYMGVSSNHTTEEADLSDPSIYKWSKVEGSKGDKGDSGEDAVLLRIDSSKGNLFKNNMVSTILSVTIIKGGERISSSSDLKRVFGESARLEWLWKRMDDSDWSTILASDSRLSDEGFIFQLSPDDVETKEVFTCNLII